LPINVTIVGPDGSPMKVGSLGEAFVGRPKGDDTAFQSLDVINTAFNMYKPRSGFSFRITGFTMKASQSVSSVSEAQVIIYESDTEDGTTVDELLYEAGLLRNDAPVVTNLYIGVNSGVFINAKTDDATVRINLFGFYIKD
jgi:hypothetical protein